MQRELWDTSPSFEDEWPALAMRLHVVLTKKRVAPWLQDDIVQETGLRLFRIWDEVDPHRSVFGLTVTIALNLLRDEARRRKRGEILGNVPDSAADYDIEEAGLASVELARVRRAMTYLSPAQRRVILAEIGEKTTVRPPSGDAAKMLRMRARRKLELVLRRKADLAFVLGFQARKLVQQVQLVVTRGAASTESQVAVPVVAGMVTALVVLPGPITLAGRSAAGGVEGSLPPPVVAVAPQPGGEIEDPHAAVAHARSSARKGRSASSSDVSRSGHAGPEKGSEQDDSSLIPFGDGDVVGNPPDIGGDDSVPQPPSGLDKCTLAHEAGNEIRGPCYSATKPGLAPKKLPRRLGLRAHR